MKDSYPVRRLIARALGWTAVLGFAAGTYAVYRWAEPFANSVPTTTRSGNTTVTMRIEEAPFAGYSNGRKSWSVWAKRIDIERQSDAALTAFQTATLTDIRSGVLYQVPALAVTAPSQTSGLLGLRPPAALEQSPSVDPPVLTQNSGQPIATFHAQHGRYALGTFDPVPSDLSLLYTVLWQFKLTGAVNLQTRSGDRIQSDSVSILQMQNRRTGRVERRILCDAGVRVTHEGVRVQANQVRYDPAERTVECLGGVRGTSGSDAVQAERAFWSLKDQVILCPESTAGVFPGGSVQASRLTWSLRDHRITCPEKTQGIIQQMPFIAEGLSIDLKRRVLHANHVHTTLRIGEEGPPPLP